MCVLLGEINKDSLQISEMEKNCSGVVWRLSG